MGWVLQQQVLGFKRLRFLFVVITPIHAYTSPAALQITLESKTGWSCQDCRFLQHLGSNRPTADRQDDGLVGGWG
jgi:hypothetical protein